MSDTPATNEEFQALLARADGGGAYYDGCPPRSETWEGYLVSFLFILFMRKDSAWLAGAIE